MKFKEWRYGLYLFDTSKKSNTNNIPVTNDSVAHYRLLIIVANNQHNDIQLYIYFYVNHIALLHTK